jgi:energy-coupling factor transporter ATP-binding protein EcfA2
MNVVIGANGAGKTTVARAVRWLLWPSTAGRGVPRVVSALTYDNLPLEINQSHHVGQEQLRLPPESHAGCFTITADDLFDGGTTDFADRVKQAITGQVSVDTLYQKEDGSRILETELARLQKHYDQRVRDIEERHGLIAGLPELREKLAEIRRAEQRLVVLREALELREMDLQLESMKGMENAAPTDFGNAQRLKDEIQALKAGITELEKQSERCRQNIGETGLERVPETLGEIRALLEDAKVSARRKSDLEESLAGLLRVLEGVPAEAGLADLDAALSSVLELEKVLDRIRELGNRKKALEQKLGGIRAEEMEKGRSLLVRWLTRKEHRDLIVPAGLLMVAVLLLRGGETPPAVLALALFAWSLLAPVAQMKQLQRKYRRTGLQEPSSWSVRDVIGTVRALESAADDHLSLIETGGNLARLQEEADDLRRRGLGIRERSGIDSAIGLELLVDRMKRSGEVDDLKGRLEGAGARLRNDLLRLGGLFGEWGVPLPDTVQAAAGGVEELERRVRIFVQEEARLRDLHRETETNRRELAALESEMAGIFSRNGLEAGDFDGLKERDGKLGSYLYLVRRRDSMKKQRCSEELCPPESLEEEIRAAEEMVATLDETREKVTLAMAAEREMERSVELVDTLSRIALVERKLEARNESNRRIRIRNRLLDTVKRKYQVEIQPPVVSRASGLLSRFTGSRYTLNPVGLEDAEFAALDSETGAVLPLEHLSRGTRMQLLLALKIAFAELAESGELLPIFLDEVLANTDLERFREVSRAMVELVRQGRQIFYLTCQEPDASLIQQVFSESGEPPVKVIRLDRASPGEWPDHAGLLESVPQPGGLGYDQYVRLLGPPGVVRGMSPGSIHPAWVLDRTDILYRLLRAGLDSLGKAVVSGTSVLGEEEAMEMELAGAAAEKILHLFSRGRSESLTRKILEESPVGRSRLLEDVWSLSARVGHNPARLLDELRRRAVPGFRSSLTDEFEAYLLKQGLLCRERPLSREEAWPMVLESAGGNAERFRMLFERLWTSLESSDQQGSGEPRT